MARAFVRRGEELETRLERIEVMVIQQQLDALCALLLDEGRGVEQSTDPLARQLGLSHLDEGPVLPPENPVLARLLPEGYRDDPLAASEFRRYTDGALRNGKLADAELLRAGLDRALTSRRGSIRISADEAVAWLRSINDLRLALGVELHLTEDSGEELANLAEDDPRAGPVAIYDFLTWWQDSLVRALLGSS